MREDVIWSLNGALGDKILMYIITCAYVCVYMFTFWWWWWWCVLSIPRLYRGHFPDHRNVRRVGATARQRLRSCQTAWHQHPPPFSPHVHVRDLLHIDCQPPTQMCHVNNEISFQADALCRYPDQLLICRSNCFSGLGKIIKVMTQRENGLYL